MLIHKANGGRGRREVIWTKSKRTAVCPQETFPLKLPGVFLVQHLDPQHCRTELKARDMGRTDWERELGEGLREVP